MERSQNSPAGTMTRGMARLSVAIYGGLAVLLALIIAVGLAGRAGMRQLDDATHWLRHTQEVRLYLQTTLSLLSDAETGQRGFLYTGKDAYLEPYIAATNGIRQNMQRLRGLLSDNPAQLARLSKIESLAVGKIDELAQTISLQKQGAENDALKLVLSDKGKYIMDSVRVQIADMVAEEDRLLIARRQASQQASRLVNAVVAGGVLSTGLIAIAIGIFFGFINRTIIKRIRSSAVAISASSSEIAATVEQHERTANQQAAAITETSATIQELSASSRRSAEQAENAAELAEKSGSATNQGAGLIHAAVIAMSGLERNISALVEQIRNLGEQTAQIGSIAALLKDLSEQINMLALNAAVQAARAGEQGKGFAVVAQEVRALADESKKSAKAAARLVEEIQQVTGRSVMMTEAGGRTVSEVKDLAGNAAVLFDDLSEMAGMVREYVRELSQNAWQQSAASLQIVEAINILTAGAKQTAAGLGQTKAGVGQLNEAADDLQAIAS